MTPGLRHQVGTLLGRPRREDILKEAPKRAVCAEIGVFRGEFSRHIVRIARPRELHLIDAWWTLYGERFPDWGAYTDYGRLTTRAAYEDARRAAPAAIVHVGDDVDILSGFPDGYFEWVYLDTSHEYAQSAAELTVLARKLKPHGLVLGDDWYDDPNHPHGGVAKAVREACVKGQWRLLLAGDRFGQWKIQLDH